MKKVLIIAHLGHASLRIFGLAKYLPEFGWQPIVLTAPLNEKPDSQYRIIETPYSPVLGFWKRLFRLNPNRDIRRQIKYKMEMTAKKPFLDFIFTRLGEIFHYPDAYKGWKHFAIAKAEEILQNEDIDAIISSSSPVTSHIIANELKERYKIPWIADLRDLWSQNHNYHYGPLRKMFDTRLELKTLLKTDALVTVSGAWAEKLRASHRRETVYAITNGFDPSTANTPPVDLTAKFTISYTGSLYAGKQDPSRLFAALRNLISEGFIDPKEIEVRFYGPEEGWLASEIEEYRLSGMVKQYGTVSRETALEKQRESQVLLLLNWEDPQETGCYPLKTFEYLAAKRPIMAVGGFGDDIIEELLHETKAGVYASTIKEIEIALKDLYKEYKLKGKIDYNGDEAKINKYSHLEMARKFVEVLNILINRCKKPDKLC